MLNILLASLHISPDDDIVTNRRWSTSFSHFQKSVLPFARIFEL